MTTLRHKHLAADFLASRLNEADADATDPDHGYADEVAEQVERWVGDLVEETRRISRPDPSDDDYEFPDGPLGDFAAIVSDVIWYKARHEGVPGSPSVLDIAQAMCWYVAVTEAEEMLECNKTREWAEFLQAGAPKIDVHYVEDWLEDRIGAWLDDRMLAGYELDGDECNHERAKFWRDLTDRVWTFHGIQDPNQ